MVGLSRLRMACACSKQVRKEGRLPVAFVGRRLNLREVFLADFSLAHRRAVFSGFGNIGFERAGVAGAALVVLALQPSVFVARDAEALAATSSAMGRLSRNIECSRIATQVDQGDQTGEF